MTKAKKNRGARQKLPDPKPVAPLFKPLPPRWRWLTDSRFLVPMALYLMVLVVWHANVFSGMGPNVTPDRAASMSLKRIASLWIDQGVFPFWNPYFYGGMAMFESFQSSWLFYPLHWIVEGFFRHPDMPGFYRGGLGDLLFLGAPMSKVILFHHLLGALGITFLVRHLGGKGWAQLAAGLLFLLSPQLVVLGDVGHGSKLYAMCWLPWVLLALDNALEKPYPGPIALLGISFAMLMATQHIQVAYYGYMLAGLWWLCRQGKNLWVHDFKLIPKDTLVLVSGGLLGIAGTSLIYLNTLTYSHDTIRGAKGVSWDYATNWSFHPLESVSMFVPDFFGFGGKTYWGYLPFTDMPMYWGIPALVLAVIALVSIRNWRIYALFAAGILAWVTSFGQFWPIIYKPFYDFLPYFNKFRVPMMIHIIVLIGAVVLAGLGLQKIFEIRTLDDKHIKRWHKRLIWAVSLSGGLLLVFLLLKGMLAINVADWVNSVKPEASSAAEMFGEKAADSILRSALLAHLTFVSLLLILHKRFPATLGGLLLIVIVIADLYPMTGRLLHPSSVRGFERYFQEDEAVKALKAAPRGRLLPLDNYRPLNTWASFGIELQGGYTGSKPATYGYLQEKELLTHPNILNVMNVQYIHSSRAVQGLSPSYQGKAGYIYRNPMALPFVYLRSSWEIIPDTEAALERLIDESFDPSKELILDRVPEGMVETDSSPGEVEIISRNPNEVRLSVSSKWQAILVLSESYTSSGWRAEANGEELEILRANGMFRAVAVPQGESEVWFRYRPANWGISLVTTVAGWLIIIALLLYEMFYSLQRRSERARRKNVVNLMNPKASRSYDS